MHSKNILFLQQLYALSYSLYSSLLDLAVQFFYI